MKFKINDKVLYRMRSEPTILRGTVVGPISACPPMGSMETGTIMTVEWVVPLQRGRHKVYVSNIREEVLEGIRALQPIKYLKQFNMVEKNEED